MRNYKVYVREDSAVRCVTFSEGDVHYSIPCDPDNTDYQQYLAWLAEGNEPEIVQP